MSKLTTAIFDLDGVIVDTAKYHYLAWKTILKEYGYNLTLKDNERLKGVSRVDACKIVLSLTNRQFNEKEMLEIAKQKNRIYLNYLSALSKNDLLPDVLSTIKYLRGHSVKIVLGSVSKNAKYILNKLEIRELFDEIVDGEDIINSKPDPEVFIKGADRVKEAYANCAVFEDSVAGILAANTVNMTSIGVGGENDLKEAKYCIKNFSRFEDIKELFI